MIARVITTFIMGVLIGVIICFIYLTIKKIRTELDRCHLLQEYCESVTIDPNTFLLKVGHPDQISEIKDCNTQIWYYSHEASNCNQFKVEIINGQLNCLIVE